MVEISLEKAKEEKLFYVVVTGVVYRESDGRCLILKRSEKEAAHPGLWSIPGGKIEWLDFEEKEITRMNHDIPNWENIVEKVLYREIKEECGLTVDDPQYLLSIGFVRPDGIPSVLIKYAVKLKSGELKLAEEFDDFAWVSSTQLKNYELLKGIKEEIDQTIKIYGK